MPDDDDSRVASPRWLLAIDTSSDRAGEALFAAPALIQSTGSDAQTALVEQFNASGQDVAVTSQPYASYEELAQALITGLQTGDVPDVAVISDVLWFRFYLSQSLADLTPFVAEPEDYVQSLFSDYQRAGGRWGIPFARSTPLMYYNVEGLEAAGLTPDIFATWSSFVEAASEFVSGSGLSSAFGFGNAASYGAWVLHGPVWAFGGVYSDPEFNILVTEEGCVTTGEFMREFVESGNAVTVTDPVTDFQTGAFGAILASTGSLGGIRDAAQFEFATAFLPEELEFGCCTGGAGLSIMANSSEENQEAAALFIDFCTNTENTSTWAQSTGYMPVRTSGVESDDFQAFLDENPNNRVAIEQLPLTRPQDSARVFIPNGDQILGQGWEQILVNNRPAAEVWEEVKTTLDEEKMPVLEQLEAIEG